MFIAKPFLGINTSGLTWIALYDLLCFSNYRNNASLRRARQHEMAVSAGYQNSSGAEILQNITYSQLDEVAWCLVIRDFYGM